MPEGAVADLATAVPDGGDGSPVFSSLIPPNPILPTSAVIGGTRVVFISYSPGHEGVFALASPNDPILRIADLNTDIPGSSSGELFTSFESTDPFLPIDPCIWGDTVAFFGAGAFGRQGLYLYSPTDSMRALVDTDTLIPGTADKFQFFGSFALEGTEIAFVGWRELLKGIKFNPGVYTRFAPTDPCRLVADIGTPVPDGIGTFEEFGAVAIDPGVVVFQATSDDGNGGKRTGLYTDFGGTLTKL